MSGPPSLWRRLLNGWLAIAAHFGEVQTLLLLGIIYLFVIGPMAIVATLARRDFLHKRELWRSESVWGEADTHHGDLDRAKHPF
jgi:hypothetical protein